ncbi:cyclin-dependent kinase C-2-like [Senna tora]|uniref:Cyclin-dependent kinase C-2-like n=1 Tax=Senna tora TaxID=362788 RepID=A0A834TZL7_9FABA|nr:cyclin-dependent kinase C-2-like [Senna tora]
MAESYEKVDATIKKWSELMPQGTTSIHNYENLDKIGHGFFSEVFKARDKQTGETVALKQLRLDYDDPFVLTYFLSGINEINILRELDHENVIKLKHTIFPNPQRDWTAENILINSNGILKLADFGMAKSITGNLRDQKFSPEVIAISYRPPELLLGALQYGTAVDIWSVGCLLAELHTGKRIFNGKNKEDSLNQIFELCGTPNETNWPGVSNLPLYTQMKPSIPKPRRLGKVYKHVGKHALDLLERMLTLDPNQRISAEDALKADYFLTDPLPIDPKSLPKLESSSHYYVLNKKSAQEMPPPKMNYVSQQASSSNHGQINPHGSRDESSSGSTK